MLLPPPRPSRWTGPPGRRPPRSSVPTSIASRLLRGPGLHSVYLHTDLDRVERLDVASPDQGEEGVSAEIGRSRPHHHTPPSEDRWRSGTAPTSSLSCVRMRPSERGVVESDRGTQGSPPARLAGPIQKFWGFLRSGSESTSSGGTSGEPSKASPLSLTANASLAEGRADLGTNRPVGACGEQPRGSSV